MIKIDKNIPIPKSVLTGRREQKYPWDDLEPGDSFFVQDVNIKSIRSQCYSRKSKGEVYAIRADNTEGVEGVRIWLLERQPVSKEALGVPLDSVKKTIKK